MKTINPKYTIIILMTTFVLIAIGVFFLSTALMGLLFVSASRGDGSVISFSNK